MTYNDQNLFDFTVYYKDETWLQSIILDIDKQEIVAIQSNPNEGDKVILGLNTTPTCTYSGVLTWINNFNFTKGIKDEPLKAFYKFITREDKLSGSNLTFKINSVPNYFKE